MLKEFKAFITKGNVIELAVAVVIGAAFKDVIDSVVKNLVTPLITIPGKTQFSEWSFAIRHSQFYYGIAMDAVVRFLIISAAVFFLIVKPVNVVNARRNRGEESERDPSTRDCPYCLSSIPLAATRCAHCTSEVAAV